MIAPDRERSGSAGARLVALIGVPILAGCAPTAPTWAPREPLLAPGAASWVTRTPGRWRYHPRDAAKVNTAVRLPDGAWLTAGAGGERWIVDLARGRAEAAARLAPEELTTILSVGERWAFVGRSGGVYEAESPLAPFDSSSGPPEPLAALAVAGGALVGLTRSGALVRSEDGGGIWDRSGPPGARLIALEMDGRRGLALAAPEAVFTTIDAGVTWARLDAPSVGALGVARVHPPVVDTVLGPRTLPDGAVATVPPVASRAEDLPVEVRPPLAPDAGALAEGRAVLAGARYVEIACVEDGARSRACERPVASRGEARLVLLDGAFDGRLSARPLRELGECRHPALALHGPDLWLACFRSAAGAASAQLELHHSSDGGTSWRAEPGALHAKASSLRLAAGAGGALVAAGICSSRLADRGCEPRGVVHRRASLPDAPPDRAGATGAQVLGLSGTPSLDGAALAIAFGSDGRTVVAVGRRTKGARLGVFVSADAGASFSVHDVEDPVAAPEVDREPPSRWDWRRRTRAVSPAASVVPAEDGTFGVTIRDAHGLRVLTVTRDGVVAVSPAPPGANLLAAAGSRALAIAGPSGRAFESLDGGATWRSLGKVPANPCGPDPSCSVPFVCGDVGCTLGSELSRVGWDGKGEPEPDPPPPASPDERRATPRHRTPIVCAIDASPWTDSGLRGEPPGASEAALGAVAWFGVAVDAATAAVSVVEAAAGSHARAQVVPLLSPAPGAAAVALIASVQLEGAAALRFPIAPTKGSSIEVAWRNLLEGRSGATRLPDALPERRPDAWHGQPMAPGGRVHHARSRLGITAGGLYARPGPSARDPWHFTDGKRVERLAPIAWPAVAPTTLPLHDELVRVSGRDVPLRLVGPAVAALRGRAAAGGWVFDALTTGPADPRPFGVEPWRSLVYVGARPALHLVFGAPDPARAESWVLPLRADGAVTEPAQRAPRPRDLADPPRPCTADERARTTRLVFPADQDVVHPVVVVDAGGAVRGLVTVGAVLHGRAESPCLAALEARWVRAAGAPAGGADAALLDPAALDSAWAFRTVGGVEPGRRGPGVEHHPMTCRWEPGAELPPELAAARLGG